MLIDHRPPPPIFLTGLWLCPLDTSVGMPEGDLVRRRGRADDDAERSHEGPAYPDEDTPNSVPPGLLIRCRQMSKAVGFSLAMQIVHFLLGHDLVLEHATLSRKASALLTAHHCTATSRC